MENPKYHITVTRETEDGSSQVATLTVDEQVWRESMEEPELLKQLLETQTHRFHG